MHWGVNELLLAYDQPKGWTREGHERRLEQQALEAQRVAIEQQRQALQLEVAAEAARELERVAARDAAQLAAAQVAQDAAEAAAQLAAAERAAREAAAAAAERLKLTREGIELGQVVPVSEAYIKRCTGNFCEASVIGRGAFGTVFMGVDTALNVRFAVKALNAESMGQAGPGFMAAWRASVRREIATLQAIRHPNIIRMFGYCVPDDLEHGAGAAGNVADDCFLVYELGAAQSLDKHLTCEALASEFDWAKRLRVLAGIACGLNYMHRSRGAPCYHRDVKTSNVVLTLAGQPKLIDCGLSVLLDETAANANQTAFSMTGGVLGTPAYTCPVYRMTHKYGDKSEVYSFGLLLLEVLSGIICSGETHVALLLEDGQLQPDARACWPAAVSDELLQLGAECSHYSKQQRPATMLLVLRRLTALMRAHCPAVAVAGEQPGSAQQERLRAAAEAWYTHQAAAAVQDALGKRTCSICFEEAVAEHGLQCCPAAGEQAAHFICCDCIANFVSTAAVAAAARAAQGEDAAAAAEHEHSDGLCCPIPGCKSPPFSTQALALKLPQAVFAQYERAMHGIVAGRAAQRAEAQKQDEISRLRQQLREEGESEAAVAEHRRYIEQEILHLKCGHCGAGWIDFDACFAVTCGRCAKQFCAWCCAGCHGDAHAHVAGCRYSLAPGSYWATPAQLEQAHRACRIRAFKEYLLTVRTQQLRQRVLNACEVHLRFIGIAMADVE